MYKSISHILLISLLFALILAQSCESLDESKLQDNTAKKLSKVVKIEAENYVASNEPFEIVTSGSELTYVHCTTDGWLALDVDIAIPGRYTTTIRATSENKKGSLFWVEDYHDNKDERTYNISGKMQHYDTAAVFTSISKDGSPLNSGLHKMKLHFSKDVKIDWIMFTLLSEHDTTPITLTQNTTGSRWEIVWADEFEGPTVDTNKWTYDAGNWGWGNNELQYYTSGREENARIENGNLIIEARKNDMGNEWTSARLTTRGKYSFIYGKIEFRAKVPAPKGNWAAGWTLGDAYVDELSWPYCGEIDILESVGFEMDDSTGKGIAHASAHCGAYYFKLGNQPTGVIEVENMNTEYHSYSVEWLPNGITAYVDDRLYATYNDTSTDLSWPFSLPQNIILNLAMGGGWGGEHGIEDVSSQKMIVDYVRVYELR